MLEPLKPSHASPLFDNLQDEQLYRFIPVEPPTSSSELKRLYELRSIQIAPNRDEIWLNWAGRLASTQTYVGMFEATISDDSALIAYSIFPPYWSNGFGQEGLAAVLDQCLTAVGVTEAVAEIDSRNIPSIRLVKRLGFEEIAFTPNADVFKGSVSDEFIFSIKLPRMSNSL